ncbi:hypothetical protein KKF84_02950 [Myxococcota bacterium]|nr:hypothetical protein [Myxococcota bacterium]MBU1534248.1 hypothetical protein [Myxococcota bacterium]
MSYYSDFHASCRLDHFTDNDLKNFFVGKDQVFIQNFVARGVRSGKFLRVKRGVYLFSPGEGVGHRSLFSLANVLYHPSYVSFESALSYHGLIPEAVYVTTSACYQRKQKEFTTQIGTFDYHYIPCDPFFDGVFRDPQRHALIAHPLRALFDLCYTRRKCYESLQELEQDLRIERDDLLAYVRELAAEEISELGELYRRKHIRNLAEVLGEYAK